MILPQPSDAIHKSWLYSIVTAIADAPRLAALLRFKGGTCAAMRNILPRFSVDLDFDLVDPRRMGDVRSDLEDLFKSLKLEIKDQSRRAPQYFLKYPNTPGERNTLKVDVTFPVLPEDDDEPVRFVEIDRILRCQALPTMFAHKLLATMGRYQKRKSLAGRDLFDLFIFFRSGLAFKKEIIMSQTGREVADYLLELYRFIDRHFPQTVIDQDLSTLMPPADFSAVRKNIKPQVLMFLKDSLRAWMTCP